MQLPARERAVLALLAQYGQLTSRHVRGLLFRSNTSRTPATRCLARLTSLQLVRSVTKNKSQWGPTFRGSENVFILTSAGKRLAPPNRDSFSSVVNFHLLAIADVMVEFHDLNEQQVIKLEHYDLEPDCWFWVANENVKPDALVEVTTADQSTRRLACEVDLGTEGRGQITAKLDQYWRAFQQANADSFPGVLFVTMEPDRSKQIQRLISQHPGSELFRVTELGSLASIF